MVWMLCGIYNEIGKYYSEAKTKKKGRKNE